MHVGLIYYLGGLYLDLPALLKRYKFEWSGVRRNEALMH